MDFFEAMQILKDGGKVSHQVGFSKITLSLETVRPNQPKVILATGHRGNSIVYRKPLFDPSFLLKSWDVAETPKQPEPIKNVEEQKVVDKKPRAKKTTRKKAEVVLDDKKS